MKKQIKIEDIDNMNKDELYGLACVHGIVTKDLTFEELKSLETEIKKRKEELQKPDMNLLRKELGPIISEIKQLEKGKFEIQVDISFILEMELNSEWIEEVVVYQDDAWNLMNFDVKPIKSNNKITKFFVDTFKDHFNMDYCDLTDIVPEWKKMLSSIQKKLSKIAEKNIKFDAKTFKELWKEYK